MQSNKIMQSFWIGSDLSLIEYLCIKSFIDNGHEFHLYTYSNKVNGCPEGTVLKDAQEIIPVANMYKDVAGTYTSFANWFRYKLLYERGGWWVDMDVVCLKNFDFSEEYCFTTEVIFDAGAPEIIANNAIIKAPAGAPFLQDMLEYMATKDLPNAKWGVYGSRFLEEILSVYESKEFIQPPAVFCPINWHQTELLFKDEIEMTFDQSYAIHLWNNIWSKRGIDKNATYSPSSLIEKLKAKYL